MSASEAAIFGYRCDVAEGPTADSIGLAPQRVVSQAGGLDKEQGWEMSLSLTEQQLLAVAKVLLAAPRFVFLDRVDTALGSEQLRKILRLLSGCSITCVNSGEAHDTRDLYHAVLEYSEDGRWTWTPNRA